MTGQPTPDRPLRSDPAIYWVVRNALSAAHQEWQRGAGDLHGLSAVAVLNALDAVGVRTR